MQTIQQAFPAGYMTGTREYSRTKKIINWCNSQQEYRYGWLAVILAAHACILAPITLLTIFAAGLSLTLCSLVMIAMTMALVPNLAAMPTKITIPVFFLSVLIDLAVIGICIATMLR